MKKKGFTLIELLAVIVILAVIALIATPMILGVIDTARKGAAESSAYGYIEALENYQVIQQVTNSSSSLFNDSKTVTELNGLVDIKGEKPTKGFVEFEKGKVTNYQLQFGEYLVKYNETSKKAEANKEEYTEVLYQGYAVGDEVTIDEVTYHVIKTSSTTSSAVTLLRDESIGEMAFDDNGGTDYETSTLKTYLNSTYKETFGEKASMIVGDITLLDFGTWTTDDSELEGITITDSINGEEGTYAYLYNNGYSNILGADYFWTKTIRNANIIIKLSYDETYGYHMYILPGDGGNICISGGFGCSTDYYEGVNVRPVITIKKEAIN